MRRAIVVALFLGLLASTGPGLLPPAGAAYDPTDEWQGLPEGAGREEVYFSCIACHSTAIVQQQRMTEYYWKYTLERMVEDMGMPALAETEYDLVLAYLLEHFGDQAPR